MSVSTKGDGLRSRRRGIINKEGKVELCNPRQKVSHVYLDGVGKVIGTTKDNMFNSWGVGF